jgi:hypothetical protein
MKENINEELNYIKYLLGYKKGFVISEQQTPVTTNTTTVVKTGVDLKKSVKIDFPAGYHGTGGKNLQITAKEGSNVGMTVDVGSQLTEAIKDFKTLDPNTTIYATISAGESQIPNSDYETGKDMKTGDLSKLRMLTIKNYLTSQFPEQVKSGKLVISEREPAVGKTPWVSQVFKLGDLTTTEGKKLYQELASNKAWVSGLKKGEDGTYTYTCGKTSYYGCNMSYTYCKDSDCKDMKDKYTTEQFIKLKLSTTPAQTMGGGGTSEQEEDFDCAAGAKIGVHFYKDGNHICNFATYEIYVNGNRLTRDDKTDRFGGSYALLNNGVGGPDPVKNDEGGTRMNYFTVSPELAKKIILEGAKGFNFTIKCVRPDIDNESKAGYKLGTTGQHGSGCHQGVGTVEIFNSDGDKIENIQNYTTPTNKDTTTEVPEVAFCKSTT